MKPQVAGLPSNRDRAIGDGNDDRTSWASDISFESMKFEVAPKSIRVGTGCETVGRCILTMNEFWD